jgi:acetyl-CoA acetyltransferase
VGAGGGAAAAITTAAAAIATGQAECVVAFRTMAQQDTGRLGYAKYHFGNQYLAHGVGAPAQVCALRTQRMLEHDGVPASAMRALVLAAYHHAQQNPTANGYGRPVDVAMYESSRETLFVDGEFVPPVHRDARALHAVDRDPSHH